MFIIKNKEVLICLRNSFTKSLETNKSHVDVATRNIKCKTNVNVKILSLVKQDNVFNITIESTTSDVFGFLFFLTGRF